MKNYKLNLTRASTLVSSFTLMILIALSLAGNAPIAVASPSDSSVWSWSDYNYKWKNSRGKSKEILLTSGPVTTGYEAKLIDPETGAEVDFALQITQSNGVILYSALLSDGTAMFFNIHQNFSDNAQGYHDTNQLVVALNASPKEFVVRFRVSVYEFNGITQPLIGAIVSVDSHQIISNGDLPVLALHTDGNLVSGTEVVDLTDLECSRGTNPCILEQFGNGAATVPVNPISENYGAVFEFLMPTFDIKLMNAKLKIANTALCADFDGDGSVTSGDLGIFLASFGLAYSAYDLNQDGVIDGADLGLLLQQYGDCNY